MEEFSSSVMLKLKKIVQFDSSCSVLLHIDGIGNIALAAQTAFNTVPDKAKIRAEYIGVESYNRKRGLSTRDPLLKKSVENQNRAHVYSLQDSSDADLKEYGRLVGSLNSLNYVSRRTDNTIETFSLWRARNEDVFVDEDVYYSNLLIPHAIQSISINRRLNVASSPCMERASGFIIAESNGLMHHVDDASIACLRREYTDWLSCYLPLDILACFQSSSAGRFFGDHIIVNMRRQGSLMMMVVQPKEAGQKLTPAELRVVEKIVQYGTYKETARQLGVSPSTVRNQLHAIYKKLGLRGKDDLIKII